MINIKVNNEYLDLFADTKVSVNYSNKDATSSEGSHFTYSENVEIPLTNRNAEILGIDVKTGITPIGIIIGSIHNGYSNVMDISIEVQSVKYNDLENTITLLVMDAMSGILNDLKHKKLNIIFDDNGTDSYYLKRASANIKNDLYQFAYVDTSGYTDEINGSNGNKYTFASRADSTATSRMVYNANKVMSNILKRYNVKWENHIDNDIYITLPYDDLSPVMQTESDMDIKNRSYTSRIQVPIRNPNDESQGTRLNQILKACGGRAYHPYVMSSLDGDFLKSNRLCGALNSDSLDKTTDIISSTYYGDREISIMPEIDVDGMVGTPINIEFEDRTAKVRRICEIESCYLESLILTMTVRNEISSIDREFPVAKIYINKDCQIEKVEKLDNYIHEEPIKVKCGDSIHVGYSISYDSNGSIDFHTDEFDSRSIIINGSDIYVNNENITYFTYFLTVDIAGSNIRSMIVDDVNRNNDKSNNILSPIKITDKYSHSAFDTMTFEKHFFKDIKRYVGDSKTKNIQTYLRDCVDLRASMYASDFTAYDLVKDICLRFNMRLSVMFGVASNINESTESVVLSDRVNSEIILNPKKYESEIMDFSIKNKEYNSLKDKLWDKRGSFDSDKIVIDRSNKKSSTLSLNSAPISDSITGKPYTASDSQVELINKFGMLSVGLTQLSTTSSDNMSFRVGYLKNNPTEDFMTSLYPCSISSTRKAIIYDALTGDQIVDTTKHFYTTDSATCILSPVDSKNMLINQGIEFFVDSKLINSNDPNNEHQIALRCQLNDSVLVVEFPTKDIMQDKFSRAGRLKLDLGSCQNTQYYNTKNELKTLNKVYNSKCAYPFNKQYINEVHPDGGSYNRLAFRFDRRSTVDLKVQSIDNTLIIYFDGVYKVNENSVDSDMISYDNSFRFCIPLFTHNAIVNDRVKQTKRNVFINPEITRYDTDESVDGRTIPRIGTSMLKTFNSYNDMYSLSFNNITSKGKISASDRYFKDTINEMSSNKNPYLDLEVMMTPSESSSILHGASLNINGVEYKVIEASDMDLGENCLVKIKIVKK